MQRHQILICNTTCTSVRSLANIGGLCIRISHILVTGLFVQLLAYLVHKVITPDRIVRNEAPRCQWPTSTAETLRKRQFERRERNVLARGTIHRTNSPRPSRNGRAVAKTCVLCQKLFIVCKSTASSLGRLLLPPPYHYLVAIVREVMTAGLVHLELLFEMIWTDDGGKGSV